MYNEIKLVAMGDTQFGDFFLTELVPHLGHNCREVFRQQLNAQFKFPFSWYFIFCKSKLITTNS
jgi:hypothetical protein